tara:strand:- start:29 stop:598 length:570 start_codon:yes stop_codon:yes gene_type:complete
MGKREFNQTLLNPITNIDKLNRSYNLTEYVIKENKWENMRIILNNMRDIEKIKRKIIMNKISPKDITILSNNIIILKNLYNEIKTDKFLLENINERINGNFREQCKIYESFLNRHFILNKMSNIDEITPERLNNLSIENLCFINKLINNELDNKIKNCMDSKEKLETIRAYFENIIKDFEKSTKVNKKQ